MNLDDSRDEVLYRLRKRLDFTDYEDGFNTGWAWQDVNEPKPSLPTDPSPQWKKGFYTGRDRYRRAHEFAIGQEPEYVCSGCGINHEQEEHG